MTVEGLTVKKRTIILGTWKGRCPRLAIPIIDKARCILCRKCEKICPARCLVFRDDHMGEDYSKCMSCGRCVRTCPVGAISFRTS